MAYEKTTWQTGDTITAEKLNNIEQGISDNETAIVQPLVVTATEPDYIGDKTWQEIYTALIAKKPVYLYIADSTPLGTYEPLYTAFYVEDDAAYYVNGVSHIGQCESTSGYPNFS